MVHGLILGHGFLFVCLLCENGSGKGWIFIYLLFFFINLFSSLSHFVNEAVGRAVTHRSPFGRFEDIAQLHSS